MAIDPARLATAAHFTFQDARNGSADPTMIKIAEGFAQLAQAVSVIAAQQQQTQLALGELLRRTEP
jgi:hypothetical protein